MKKLVLFLALSLSTLATQPALAAYQFTGWVRFDIQMDNGRTYFYPMNADGSNMELSPCLYSRIELNDTGDSFGSLENGRRMMAMALAAKSMGLRVRFGFDTAQAPACRVAELQVEWSQ